MSPVAITLALLLFVIVMFVWEKIPLAVTSIIALLVLVLTGVLSPKDAFGGFVDNNLILFVAMFVIGGCFFETGMANRVGGIVTKFAHTERELIVAVMLVTGIMSGFLSNTGTAAILIPIVIGTASKSGFSRSRLLLPLIFAAAMGGNLSIIGAPGNLLGKAALQNVGVEISFFEYGFVGLPILLISTAFFACVGYRFLPEKTKNMGDSMYDEEQDFSDVPRWKQMVSLVVMVLTILAMIYNGGYWTKPMTIQEAIGNCNSSAALVLGGFMALILAFIMFVPRKLLSFKDFMSNIATGINTMVPAYIILTLAWTIGTLCQSYLGTGKFIGMLVEQSHLPVELIPAIVFLVSAGLSFSIGTAWGTFGIFIPIVVFICQAAPSEIMTVTLAATLAGSVFGDHCSPISDTTILSSSGAGCNHMQHVATQIPYATVVAISCFISYIVAGVTGGSAPLTLLTGVGMLYLLLFVLHRRAKKRHAK